MKSAKGGQGSLAPRPRARLIKRGDAAHPHTIPDTTTKRGTIQVPRQIIGEDRARALWTLLFRREV